jgi:ribosomal RNA-processing protein 12
MNEEIVIDALMAEESKKEKAVLSKAAEMLLPALFKNVEKLYVSSDIKDEMDVENEEIVAGPTPSPPGADLTQRTTKAIASLAGWVPTPFLQKLFKKLIRRLLEESQAESEVKDKLCSLLSLSQALVASESLDESSVMLLYRTMKPMIRSDEHGPKAQKLAYKVLAEICRCHHSFVSEAETLKELIGLLTSAALTSQVPARGMRLKCMGILVDGFDAGALNDLVRSHLFPILIAFLHVCFFLRILLNALLFLNVTSGRHYENDW